MRFSQILSLCDDTCSSAFDPEITGITADSRHIQPGMLFVALTGAKLDGGAFITDAWARGAAAVISDRELKKPEAGPDKVLFRKNAAQLLARIATLLSGPQPRRIAAVTGTNGKSSTADFLRQLWTLQGDRAASLGTLGLISDTEVPAPPSLTTPDPVGLARTLAALKRSGVDHVALEASSHGLQQHRLDGVMLSAAGFSNLTRDHLDYHLTIDAYRTAKLRLFSDVLPEGAVAAINADMDETTRNALHEIARRRSLRLRTVGRQGETIRLVDATPTPSGQILRVAINGRELPPMTLALPGLFQADNALLAAAMCWSDDSDAEAVLSLLPKLVGVHGRCERVVELASGAAAYVDYAHTPDALETVLTSLRPHTHGKLVVVFGAGGDRDRGKRPLMGAVAAKMADLAIVTDDNPRTEPPRRSGPKSARHAPAHSKSPIAGLQSLQGSKPCSRAIFSS